MKPQNQRLGSFVVWFNVTAPPWGKEGHLGGTFLLTAPGSPCVPSSPSGLGLGALHGTRGGGRGLLSTPSKFQSQSGLLSAEHLKQDTLTCEHLAHATPTPMFLELSSSRPGLLGPDRLSRPSALVACPPQGADRACAPPWPIWATPAPLPKERLRPVCRV